MQPELRNMVLAGECAEEAPEWLVDALIDESGDEDEEGYFVLGII